MEVRQLTDSDLDGAYALRLTALEKAPLAFLTTLAEERARGDSLFRKTLSQGGDQNVIFGAFDPTLVGLIGIFVEDRPKWAHKAHIWGMYVEESHRGKGVAGLLLDRALSHARRTMAVAAVYLSVVDGNEPAKRLYESRGFRCWGTEPKATLADGKHWDEHHLVLEL